MSTVRDLAPGDVACAICGDDAARYEANHGASGPFSVVPEPKDSDS